MKRFECRFLKWSDVIEAEDIDKATEIYHDAILDALEDWYYDEVEIKEFEGEIEDCYVLGRHKNE